MTGTDGGVPSRMVHMPRAEAGNGCVRLAPRPVKLNKLARLD